MGRFHQYRKMQFLFLLILRISTIGAFDEKHSVPTQNLADEELVVTKNYVEYGPEFNPGPKGYTSEYLKETGRGEVPNFMKWDVVRNQTLAERGPGMTLIQCNNTKDWDAFNCQDLIPSRMHEYKSLP